MHPKEALLKLLKSLGVDIRQAIVGLILGSLVVAYGGLLLLSKAVLNYSILLLTTPTPLWATISLVLLGYLYIYLRFRKLYSSTYPSEKIKDSSASVSVANRSKIKFFTFGNYKWKVDIYPNGHFREQFWDTSHIS